MTKKSHLKDTNQLAKHIVDIATGTISVKKAKKKSAPIKKKG